MKLKEIMTKDVETIAPGESIESAATAMKVSNVGFLPVLEADRLVGVLTDRDIVVRAVGDGAKGKRVKDVMTKDLVTIREDEDHMNAMKAMRDRRISRVVVLNGKGRLAGVVSANDVARACTDVENVRSLAKSLGEAHKCREVSAR
jgi:CBS domain-containing protein